MDDGTGRAHHLLTYTLGDVALGLPPSGPNEATIPGKRGIKHTSGHKPAGFLRAYESTPGYRQGAYIV